MPHVAIRSRLPASTACPVSVKVTDPSSKSPVDRDLYGGDIVAHLTAQQTVGVPYTEEDLASAPADLWAQASIDGDHEGVLARYPKAAVGDFDGQPGRLTEMDALVAYLQILGRMVDFTAIRAEDLQQ
jgi:cytochrome c oxidase cbb3-type subunit 2